MADCRCTAQVRMKTVMPRWTQCKRTAMEGSLFCGSHDPEVKAKRAEKHEDSRLARENRMRAMFVAKFVAKQKRNS